MLASQAYKRLQAICAARFFRGRSLYYSDCDVDGDISFANQNLVGLATDSLSLFHTTYTCSNKRQTNAQKNAKMNPPNRVERIYNVILTMPLNNIMALFRRMGNKKVVGLDAQARFNQKLDEIREFLTDVTHVGENGKRNGPVGVRPKRSLSYDAADELDKFNATFALVPEIGNYEQREFKPLVCTAADANDGSGTSHLKSTQHKSRSAYVDAPGQYVYATRSGPLQVQ